MAELVKSFVTLNKDGGSGNDTITATANSINTGRNIRNVGFTFSAENCSPLNRTVYQQGKPEFVSFDNATPAVPKSGSNITITGKSNSSKLTFSLGNGGTLNITLPSSYTAGGNTTNNGVAISGDPGASAEYAFSITISNIAENTTITALTKQLIVTPNSGTAATCTITQAAGDPTLSVSPETVTIPWDASESKSFAVTSNTSWTIS